MLSGGEKAKIKNIVMAIKGDYPQVLEVLEKKGYEKHQDCIDTLFSSSKRIFMWLAHLPTTIINSNEVLSNGFDAFQEANRVSRISSGDRRRVQLLIDAINYIPLIQEELIKLISNDNDARDRVLKDIMDELGIENPNKKKKNNKKYSSMSFDDWFNDD